MAWCPSLRMWIASLIHLVALSGSLSITDASDQFIAWFSCRAWSVRAYLLYSAEVLERWLLVKVCLVLNSTLVLCSCNLTPSFLPVSPTYVLSHHILWKSKRWDTNVQFLVVIDEFITVKFFRPNESIHNKQSWLEHDSSVTSSQCRISCRTCDRRGRTSMCL